MCKWIHNAFPLALMTIWGWLGTACGQDAQIRVTSYGAAGKVSGSMHLVEYRGKKILVDCGSHYPDAEDASYEKREKQAKDLNLAFPFDPGEIDHVMLTHAHLDHCGRVPFLVKRGFTGTINCTESTLPLLRVMLLMSIRYSPEARKWKYSSKSIKTGNTGESFVTAHWTDCPRAVRISAKNLVVWKGAFDDAEDELGYSINPCKQCAAYELQQVMALVKTFSFSSRFRIDQYAEAEFHPAGHIPGAASVSLDIMEANGVKKRLLFSGDLGNVLSTFDQPPAIAPEADFIWVESTYGGVTREGDIGAECLRFQHEIAAHLQQGGLVWIPAFALDRTQKVLFQVGEAMKNGIIDPSTPVYCPSPTADTITGLYRQESQNRKYGWFRDEIYGIPDLFPLYNKQFKTDYPRPCILITTGGMIDKGFAEDLMPKYIRDPEVKVFIVGYQDPFSPGGQLLSGAKAIDWKGGKVPVRCSFSKYSLFSAHADANDILQWLGKQDRENVHVNLIHGDPGKLGDQKTFLMKKGFIHVKVAAEGEAVIVD